VGGGVAGGVKKGGGGCSLCELLGRYNAESHRLGTCYANPVGSSPRPIIIKLRLAEIKRKGMDIPDCMKSIADDPAWQLKPRDGAKMRESQMTGKPLSAEQQGGVSQAWVKQLDADFHALLEANEGDVHMAFKDACAANFVLPGGEGVPEVELSPTFMFREGGDLQAAARSEERQHDVIRKHLSALKEYSEADLQAAVQGDDDESMASGSDDDSSDDEPLINKLNKGSPMREIAIQTGGVMGGGRVVRTGQQEQTLGRQVAKMRVLLPLF
jgi:hypothetical protein